MAVISTDTDSRYWLVTDVDTRPDGAFDINLKQVKDYLGAPMDIHPYSRMTVKRPQAIALGTIIRVDQVTTVDRTITVNPTS